MLHARQRLLMYRPRDLAEVLYCWTLLRPTLDAPQEPGHEGQQQRHRQYNHAPASPSSSSSSSSWHAEAVYSASSSSGPSTEASSEHRGGAVSAVAEQLLSHLCLGLGNSPQYFR